MNDFNHFPNRIPIFPLPMVFFPGQVRGLHIFEPRYKELLQMCIHTGSPFGIVLENRPTKNEPNPLPHEIGVLAHIIQVARQPDDTFMIQIYGGERFRVKQYYHDMPFLQASIDSAPLGQTDTDLAHRMFETVSEMLEEYLDALTQASGFDFQIPDVPETPEQLGYLTAVALQINNEQKQELLGKATLPELFQDEIVYLTSELDLMDWINNTIESPINNIFSGFGPENAISLN
jgi:Lon protease-like protein